jgi:alpha-L-rhamnosidase
MKDPHRHFQITITSLIAILLVLTLLPSGIMAGSAPTNLRCEYCVNPLGIDSTTPKFSWVVNDTDRGESQTAYQIIVASSQANIDSNYGDKWDSGTVSSAEQCAVKYNGSALASKTKFWWKLRSWDKDNGVSVYSAAATFETAMLSPSDWAALWVGGNFNLIRKEFTLPAKTISQARAYVSAQGYYELRINGSKIGDHVLDPGYTKYSARALYATYDVTSNVRTGANGVGIMLGNAYYGSDRKAIFQLEVKFTDGTSATVVSDLTWKGNAGGPVISNSIYDGETYDARNEMAGWDNSGFNDSTWTAVSLRDSGLAGWSVVGGELDVNGGDEDLSRIGSTWTDYTFEFDAKVANITGGWLFRASDTGNLYMWQLLDKTHATDPNKIRLHKKVNGTYTVLANVSAGKTIELNTGYHIKMALSGTNIKTYLDGVLIDDRNDSTFSSGKVGFRESSGTPTEHATFDNVLVKAGTTTLLSDDFSGGLGNWGNPLPITAQLESIKVITDITPVAVTQPQTGVYVFDMGQNIAGWAQLTVSGPAGTTVTMKYAELLYASGMINQENLRSAKATDKYTLKGSGTEIWEPHFTYHGFRYVEVTGFPGTPTAANIKGRVVHSAVDFIGTFTCSNSMLNTLQSNYVWTQRDNIHSIPTDCCQRDERQGWMADAEVSSDGALLNFEMARFFSKWFNDMDDCQRSDGSLTDVVPDRYTGNDPPWLSANVLVPWDVYMAYGDKALLDQHYTRMTGFLGYLQSIDNANYLISQNSYGDWIAPVATSQTLLSTGYYYYCAKLVSQMATELGKTSDANTYATLANNIKNSFNSTWLINGDHYDNNSQCANALALHFGIVPDANKAAVVNSLVNNVITTRSNHLSTGTLGTQLLMEALRENDQSSVAYTIANQTTYPSWGYMLSYGATTIWELWEYVTGNGMNSHNHPMLGAALSAWLYKDVAGISAVKPGYKEIKVRPQAVGDLTSANASVNTIRGTLSSSWTKSGNQFSLNVTIPVNSSSVVYIPTFGLANVTIAEGTTTIWQNNQVAGSVAGVSYKATEGNYITWNVGSGSYSFVMNGSGGSTPTPTPTPTPVPTPGATLLADDFSGDLSKWVNTTNASISGGQLTVTNNESMRSASGGSNWTDYVLEADVKITNTAAGLVFRGLDDSNFYMWQLNTGNGGQLRPHKKVSGIWTVIKEVTTGFVANTTYHVKIIVDGSTIKTYIGGSLVDTTSDTAYTSGKVGFRQSGTEAAVFDNVVVSNINYDYVDAGESVSESAHNLQKDSRSGVNTEAGFTRRYAQVQASGSWFSYDVSVPAGVDSVRFDIRETCDRAATKDYNIYLDGVLYQHYTYNTSGAGSYIYTLTPTGLSSRTADGKLVIKFEEENPWQNYDPSIADVWVRLVY